MAYKQKKMSFGEGTDLTKTPVGPVAEKKKDDKGTLKLHLEKRADAMNAPTASEMSGKGDFNISNLHKDTKISLDKKKATHTMPDGTVMPGAKHGG